MKRATVRQLRQQLDTILSWLEEGESVAICKRGKIIATLIPPPKPKPARPRNRPDFAARLKRIFGDKAVRGDVVVEERESRPF